MERCELGERRSDSCKRMEVRVGSTVAGMQELFESPGLFGLQNSQAIERRRLRQFVPIVQSTSEWRAVRHRLNRRYVAGVERDSPGACVY